MNEAMRDELRQRVERIVGPVVAGARRKRRMQEELIWHLQAVFEEEMQDIGDQRRAMETAVRRLGDAGELREQLQQTVPMNERMFPTFMQWREKYLSQLYWLAGIGALVYAWAVIAGGAP